MTACSTASVTDGIAEHERDMNGAILPGMPSGTPVVDLLAVPVAAMLAEPTTADELAVALGAAGLNLGETAAADLLAGASALGLARVAGYEADNRARYVRTSLGQRAAAALVSADPELRIGLVELERLRSDLLATIGHELRTPLTSIRTSVGLLLDPGLAPSEGQTQQLLGTIARSADRMQQLLGELLDLARLRSGRLDLERTDFDARDLVAEVAAAVSPMAEARRQTITLDVGLATRAGDGRPSTPRAGAPQPRRQRPEVLAVRCRDPHRRRLLAMAGSRGPSSDHGPGISADEQERLFERFFVGTSDRAGPGGGAGIGLPTALAIAQAHGGTIEVDSATGRGSTFRLVIPRPPL